MSINQKLFEKKKTMEIMKKRKEKEIKNRKLEIEMFNFFIDKIDKELKMRKDEQTKRMVKRKF